MKISKIPSMLVVARYNEDISWLGDVKIPYLIYDKGDVSPDGIKAGNIGLDPETYLSFIIENYDSLPDRVFFTQGNPFDHVSREDFFYWLNKWIEPGQVQSGAPILRLAPVNIHWDGCSDNHDGISPSVRATWSDLFASHIPEIIYYPAGQIFGYSSKRIRSREIASWETIRAKLRGGHGTHNCSHPEAHKYTDPCYCLTPFSSHCIERLWFYL